MRYASTNATTTSVGRIELGDPDQRLAASAQFRVLPVDSQREAATDLSSRLPMSDGASGRRTRHLR